MTGVFKRRDGWTLEKELPHRNPLQIYQIPIYKSLNISLDLEADISDSVYVMQFELVDYWKDSGNNYVKVFYEEV